MGVSVLVCMCRRETDVSVWCGGTTATKTSTQSDMAASTISKLPEPPKMNKKRRISLSEGKFRRGHSIAER